jgi:hypothetical protein
MRRTSPISSNLPEIVRSPANVDKPAAQSPGFFGRPRSAMTSPSTAVAAMY